MQPPPLLNQPSPGAFNSPGAPGGPQQFQGYQGPQTNVMKPQGAFSPQGFPAGGDQLQSQMGNMQISSGGGQLHNGHHGLSGMPGTQQLNGAPNMPQPAQQFQPMPPNGQPPFGAAPQNNMYPGPQPSPMGGQPQYGQGFYNQPTRAPSSGPPSIGTPMGGPMSGPPMGAPPSGPPPGPPMSAPNAPQMGGHTGPPMGAPPGPPMSVPSGPPMGSPSHPGHRASPMGVPPSSGPPSMNINSPPPMGAPPISNSAPPPPSMAIPGPPSGYMGAPPPPGMAAFPTGPGAPPLPPGMGASQMGGPPAPSSTVSGQPMSMNPMSGPPSGGPPQHLGGMPAPMGGMPMQMQQNQPGMPGSFPVQNGIQTSPTSAFQPPGSKPGAPPQQMYPSLPQSGYNMASPTSPDGGQYPQPGPQIGQGYAKPPPPMYPQTNGQTAPQYPGQPGQPPVQQQPGVPGGYQGGYGGPQGPGYPQQQRPVNNQQQPRKLDPDQMPSPVQVIEDDRKARNGTFGTGKTGVMPPLVTTDFEVNDEGNCGPNYMRSTVYSVPCSPDMLKQTQVPLALAIIPFARHARTDGALPLSVFSEEIVRCNRCKAYMSPFMQFMDGGRRFQCVFCKATSEVPQSYFNHLDHMGQRVDKWNRAELCLGSYEILATKEYCKNNVFPKPPAFIFVLDVSYNAIRSGLVQLFCENIKEMLSYLPGEEGNTEESAIRVGLLTYSSVVHFYNLSPSLTQPQMMVVPDVNDMFVPFLDGCLVDPKQASGVIDALLQEIPVMFKDTRETETILGPAIQAGMEALKASECAGKLFVFHTTLPTAEAPGKLKNRDDRKLLGTEKEKQVLVPGSTYYAELGQQCVSNGCSVDLFLLHNSFTDVATIGQVAKVTGGQVYKYTYFQAETDGERFLRDLQNDISKPIAFDAVMRVRTSTGIRPTDFYGNFYMSNTTDVELASIDSDKCITVEVKYDDKLPENECAYVQVALLYTSVTGQRKLRLHNLCLATCTQMADMFRNCELDVIMNLLCKQSLRQLLETNPKAVREAATARGAQILASYRKHCATASSSGQLILPECMKLLPLYLNCMMKCDAISGGPELSIDDRAYGMLSLCSMDIQTSQAYLYPRLLPVHDLDVNEETVPVPLRCSVEKLRENGAYILENGSLMFLYIGLQVDPSWVQGVFGVPSATSIQLEKGLPMINTPQNKRLRELVDSLRQERIKFMRLYLVRQGDKLELVLRQFLVEDRMSESQPSYVDFLCHLHKEIRNLIS